jgi:2-C-methyl-D-erythritol 4-phosphate cytidylyltransferase
VTPGVVIVAAGTGERLGRGGPKALVRVAGRPMLAHALALVLAAELPPPVVVHTPGERVRFEQASAGLPVGAWVAGGDSRTASVRAGVAALPAAVDTVVVHDAARPLTPVAVVRAVVAAVTGDVVAAAPAIPVADTLKRVEGTTVVATIDRSGIVGVQTPQAFPRDVLVAALDQQDDATDDLALVERLVDAGRVVGRVVVTRGSAWGRKVTFPRDLAVVTALAAVPSDLDDPNGAEVAP